MLSSLIGTLLTCISNLSRMSSLPNWKRKAHPPDLYAWPFSQVKPRRVAKARPRLKIGCCRTSVHEIASFWPLVEALLGIWLVSLQLLCTPFQFVLEVNTC